MTYKPGGAIPDPATSYAIVHLETPSADLSKIICEAFLARGMAASIVADAGSAMQAQAIVRYETSWMWDMEWFLHMITISTYDPANNELQVATLEGRTSLSRNIPRKVVEAAMVPVYGDVKSEVLATSGNCVSPIAVEEDE
jgi:hypothetical protein